MSHAKNPGLLGYIGDYTTQLYRNPSFLGRWMTRWFSHSTKSYWDHGVRRGRWSFWGIHLSKWYVSVVCVGIFWVDWFVLFVEMSSWSSVWWPHDLGGLVEMDDMEGELTPFGHQGYQHKHGKLCLSQRKGPSNPLLKFVVQTNEVHEYMLKQFIKSYLKRNFPGDFLVPICMKGQYKAVMERFHLYCWCPHWPMTLLGEKPWPNGAQDLLGVLNLKEKSQVKRFETSELRVFFGWEQKAKSENLLENGTVE